MIKQDVVKVTDAWRRHEYTGTFVRTWIQIAPGTFSLVKMERVS